MRLTEKKENGFYELTKGNEIYGEENRIRLVQIIGKKEDIEEELGLPLKVYVYLTQMYFADERIWIENIYDDEEEKRLTKEVNGREQRYIVDIDFIKRKVIIQGTKKWTTAKFKDYGKTWALTKEELE